MHHLFHFFIIIIEFFFTAICRIPIIIYLPDFNDISFRFPVDIKAYMCCCSLFWYNALFCEVLYLQPNDISRFLDVVYLRVPHHVTVTIMIEHISKHHKLDFSIFFLWSYFSLDIDSSSLSPYY